MDLFTWIMLAIIVTFVIIALVYKTKFYKLEEQYELMKEQYEIRLEELKEKK